MDPLRLRADLERLAAVASDELNAQDWHGPAGEIAQTGEEDPLAMVDDPDLKEVIAAKMALRRSPEPPASYQPDQLERELANAMGRAAKLDEHTTIGAESWVEVCEGLIEAAEIFLEARQFDHGDSDRRIQQLSMLARFRDTVEQL